MSYRRQRKAATQVMQTSVTAPPIGDGQEIPRAEQHSRISRDRTTTAQGMQRLTKQYTSELQKRRECDG